MNPTVRIKDVVMVPVSELVHHPKNPNHHPPEQIEELAKIIEAQGWRRPITVSNQTGFVTVGNGRFMAAALRGWSEVPVTYQDYDDQAQEYADLVADNAIDDWAELDLSAINKDIIELGPDFDISLLGIKDFVLDPSEIDSKLGHFALEYSEAGGVKQIVIAFEAAEYEAIVPKLKGAIDKAQVESIKELFTKLLDDYLSK